MATRMKTEYPGIVYRIVKRRARPGKTQKSFFIVFKKGGKVYEEKVGLQFDDSMTPAKANQIRSQRIENKRLSPKEIREKENNKEWTFQTLWAEYVKQRGGKVNHADQSRFKTYIEPTIGNKQPEDITARDVDKIRSENLKSKSDATCYAVIALISRIANFGRDHQHSNGLSFRLKKPKVNNEKTECLTNAELKRFLKVLGENPGDTAASLKMALFTGARRKEIFRLEWRDIDEEKGFILLRDPKGKKDETVPLNNGARQVIQGQPRDRLKVFRKKSINSHYNEAIELKHKAGLPDDFRIYHGCRHTFASMLASSGKVDLYVLQRLLTHKNSQQTQRYAHLRDSALMAGSEVAADIFQV